MSVVHDHLHASGNLNFVARQNGSQNRQLQIMHFCLICKSSQIFGQAGPAKREARHQVSGRDVEFLVVAENLHDLVRVNPKSLAQVPDLICKSNLQCMPAVADILDHLGSLQISSDQRSLEFFIKRCQRFSARTV